MSHQPQMRSQCLRLRSVVTAKHLGRQEVNTKTPPKSGSLGNGGRPVRQCSSLNALPLWRPSLTEAADLNISVAASPSTSSPLLPSFSHHSLLSFSPLARFGRRSIAVPLYVPPQLQQSPLPVGHIFCLSFFSSPQSPVRKLRLCFRLTILPP